LTLRDVLPAHVFQSIQQHLIQVGNSAHSGWQGASSEEDTLTGDFCGRLRIEWQTSVAAGRSWKWRVRYKKFRGRGKRAFEKRSGADGIIQIEVTRDSGQVRTYKGLLFQAKKNLSGPNAKTIRQVQTMEKIVPGGSALFLYMPDAFRAIAGFTYLEHSSGVTVLNLGSFLGDAFLPCTCGLRGLYYDAVRELLLIPAGDQDIRAVPVDVRHRVLIEAQEID
jgi:hypothetical protein